MSNLLIAYFPQAKEKITQDGYILKVAGETIEKEFDEMGDSRTTDDYDLDVTKLPVGEGIYCWEGKLGEPHHIAEARPFIGKWRPATVYDLIQAGLIK